MKNGGPVFPIMDTTQANDINSLACVDGGMSLRDHIAGHIFSGLALDYLARDQIFGRHEDGLNAKCRRYARESYIAAAAFIAEKEALEAKEAKNE